MSTLTTTQLQQQYIAYFGRPGDPAGITYWLGSGITEKAFAENIHAQDEYQKSTVGSKSTEDQVNDLYLNLFGRSADAKGLLYWTGEVEAGRKALSSLALDLIWSASNPTTTNSTQGAADATALENKVAAAKAFTTDVEASTDAILAYQPAATGADFKTGAAFDSAKTWLKGITTVAHTDAGVDTAVSDMQAASNPGVTTTTKALTTGVDIFTGGNTADTFTGSESTLNSGDALTGGTGLDTFAYSSQGAAAVTETGFSTTGIETLKITSTATGGTTINGTSAADVTKVLNASSSTDVTVNSLKELATVELDSVSAGNTTVNFADSLLTGTADTLTLNLKGNITTTSGAIGTVTAGNSTASTGFEIVNINSSSSASEITNVITGAATINVTGDKALEITGALASATTVNAADFTGNLSVVLDSDTADKDVVVTGGSGNDTADFTDGFQTGDSFTGGDGTDSIKLTQAVADDATLSGTLTGVEQLIVSDDGTGTIDMDNFSGVTKVIYDTGLTANGTATVDDAVTGITVEIDQDNLVAADASLVIDLKTDGTDDAATVIYDTVGAGDGAASLNAADAETLTITVDDDTTDATGTFVLASLTASDATKIVLTGDAAFTLTDTVDPVTPVLATLDAGAYTDTLTIGATNFASGGATITLGSANDVFTFATATGADTIDLSKGGNDRIVYTAVAQSDSDMDTIKGFTSGSDDIDLRTFATAITASSQFAGTKATFALAQGAVTAAKPVVYQADDQILWVDSDADQDLDGSDFRVKLEGVTELAASDLMLATAGNSITANQAAYNTATSAHFSEVLIATNEDDTITSTGTQVAGSTIDGLTGTDKLVLTGTTAADLTTAAGQLVSIETIDATAGATSVSVLVADTGSAAGSIMTITGKSGTAQTLHIDAGTDDLTGMTIRGFETLSDGSVAAAAIFTMDEDNFTDITTVNFAGGTADHLILDGGTYDFSSKTLTFGTAASSLLLNGGTNTTNKVVTLDAADLANVGTITGEDGDGTTTINMNDADNWGAVTVTQVDTVNFAGTSQAYVVDVDDLTTTNFLTLTSTGTTNTLELNDTAGDDGNITLVNTTISGFTTITTEQGSDDLTLDAASLSNAAAFSLAGDSTTDLILSETDDLSNMTITAGDFDSLVLSNGATGVTLTAGSGLFSGISTIAAITGVNGGAAEVVNLTMASAGTLDTNGLLGITNATMTITGSSGNDTVDLAVAGSATDTVLANTTVALASGGADTVNIDNNAHAAGSNELTVTGFEEGIGSGADKLAVVPTSNTVPSAYIVISSAGTTVADGDGNFIEVASSVATISSDFGDTSAGGVVEAALATAIGTHTANIATSGLVVFYGSGALADSAAIYEFATTASAGDLTAANSTVEHLATLSGGITADALVSANFIG